MRRLRPDNMVRVIGIDPGSVSVGYGIIDARPGNLEVLRYGVIETGNRDLGGRLEVIQKALARIIRQTKPSRAAVEELFFAKNKKTALRVSESRGVIFLLLCRFRIPVSEFSPLHVKRVIAGYGRAQKSQMQRIIQSTLNLPSLPRPDDAADALAIALCGIYESRFLNEKS